MSTENHVTISIAYDEFLDSKDRARKTARAEYDRVLAREQEDARQAFSRRLQIAHAQGMTKADLRVATRQYNNPGFKDLFDAYEAAPGEFDHLNPAKIAQRAAAEAHEYRVESVTYFEHYGKPTDEPEWLVLVNDAGDTQRVYVGMPKQLDLYARKYDNPPAAVDAAREHLVSLGILTGEQ